MADLEKIFKKKIGFSLMELLVVIFIITIIAGAGIAGFSQNRKYRAVSSAAQRLAADLRRSQTIALSGAQNSGYFGAGVFAQNGAADYAVFIDANNDRIYSAGIDTILETVNLENGVQMQLSVSPLSVFFAPPGGAVYINGVNSGSAIFTLTGGAYDKIITINSGGRIDIN